MKFNEFYKVALNENLDDGDSYTTLGYRLFKGLKNDIKVAIVKYVDEMLPTRIIIKSLTDPKIFGHLEYPSKKDAILAFNNLETLSKVVDFVNRYKNELTMYDLSFLAQDETPEDEKKEPEEVFPAAESPIPTSEIPMSAPGEAMPSPNMGMTPPEEMAPSTPEEVPTESPAEAPTSPLTVPGGELAAPPPIA